MTRFFPAIPVLILGLCLVWISLALRPSRATGPYDLFSFGRLPVSHNGRVKPLETVARANLLLLSGRRSVRRDGQGVSAVQWFIDTATGAQGAGSYEVFRVDHPDVRGLIGQDEAGPRQRFALGDLLKHRDNIVEQAREAHGVRDRDRTPYQRKVLELAQKISALQRVMHLDEPFVIAPLGPGDQWGRLPDALEAYQQSGDAHPSARAYAGMFSAYQQGQADQFNQRLASYAAWLQQHKPQQMWKVYLETVFNRVEPFYRAAVLYVVVLVLGSASWLVAGPSRASINGDAGSAIEPETWSSTLMRSANVVLVLALVVHTIGLGMRMYLEARPPVTNLYSSAIFIGWGCVVLGLILERGFRNGFGTAIAAVLGFATLVIAHNLDDSGDTMEMMRAVLDSNFWLSTHVVAVTIGYASTFLAGALGIFYIFGGLFTRSLAGEGGPSLRRAIFGTVCFATFMSFVGTILGGIWADQSWGRFWGWDPKENGALIIVLWNALILHARWGGLVLHRGLAVLAVFGNVITAWSWFGVNMLGVGLHSYGFIDSAVFWLLLFVASQLAIMALGLVPLRFWVSYRTTAGRLDDPGAEPDSRGEESPLPA